MNILHHLTTSDEVGIHVKVLSAAQYAGYSMFLHVHLDLMYYPDVV
jgi:hypothetical protein